MDALTYKVANSAIGAALSRAVAEARAGAEARTYHVERDLTRGYNVPAGHTGLYNDEITHQRDDEMTLDGELIPADASGSSNYVELPAIIVLGLDSSGVLTPLEKGDALNIESVIPGTGATNLGKAEDTAVASGDVGVGALVEQQNAPTSTAGNGDWSFLQASLGALWVRRLQRSECVTQNVNVTTAGTRVNLAVTAVNDGCFVKAKHSNTGLIYVGDSGVTSANGFVLQPGQETPFLHVTYLSSLYIDSSVSGEGAFVIGV